MISKTMIGAGRSVSVLCRSVLPTRSSSFVRHSSVLVDTDQDGLATVSLNKHPANSLNLEFLKEIVTTLDQVENDGCRGVVLTSALPTVFCAGVEITEMHKPDKERLRQFWTYFQDLWIKLYGCKLPMAAAINGHSPAGGCVVATLCDYRVMVRQNYKIGLNETWLGLVAPTFAKDAMVATVGLRQAEMALMTGKLYNADEAAKIGLVDEVVENKEEAIARSSAVVKQLMRIPAEARHKSKLLLRQSTLDKVSTEELRKQDLDLTARLINDAKSQQYVEMYLKGLKARSKNKKS